jgi:hypothetical protein
MENPMSEQEQPPPAWLADVLDFGVGTVNAAAYWWGKLETAPFTRQHRNQYMAARHGLSPRQVGRMTYGELALILRQDYEGAAVAEREPAADGAMMTYTDLARQFKVPTEPLRKALERWRQKHPEGSGRDWSEVADRKPRSPLYVFRVGAILHVVQALQSRG